jgi:hypothetical protein
VGDRERIWLAFCTRTNQRFQSMLGFQMMHIRIGVVMGACTQQALDRTQMFPFQMVLVQVIVQKLFVVLARIVDVVVGRRAQLTQIIIIVRVVRLTHNWRFVVNIFTSMHVELHLIIECLVAKDAGRVCIDHMGLQMGLDVFNPGRMTQIASGSDRTVFFDIQHDLIINVKVQIEVFKVSVRIVGGLFWTFVRFMCA